jgi:hypothetical protein
MKSVLSFPCTKFKVINSGCDMTMNPLPPQAYTKETLLKAYQWLMGQNSSLKEIATTPDILVSLYLKATRDGDSALERPSIQNFKNELKSLAGMMGEFAPQQPPPQQHHHHHPAGASASAHVMPTPVVHVQQPTVMPMNSAHPMSAHPHPPTQTQVSYTEKTMTATTRTPDLMELLDTCSKAMIQEVKEEFNLSSEVEALRMLIKIGHSRAKAMLRA